MTSSQAAKRLGLSMATIQKLVDNNILQAWKTLGGHRRIALASVLNYQNANNILDRSRLNGDRRTKVMLVIDSAELTNRLRNEIPQWGLALQVVFQESLTEALLELLNEKHDLLVIQMGGLRKPQEKNLDIVQKFMRARHSVAHTLVLTPERDLWSTNTIDTSPASIQVLQHELSPLWLSAYLSGFVALKRT
ncbi:excisionase family DNA-binding protein [Limnohabitans sp. DCL3]|uniref:excisionase family DNA-binding protein n=1 Tax=Limnohabitans sp. DCL3 TaxID=3374103 RepID=UPI003A87EA01